MLPRIDECIDLLDEPRMFSPLDAASKYWEIMMKIRRCRQGGVRNPKWNL